MPTFKEIKKNLQPLLAPNDANEKEASKFAKEFIDSFMLYLGSADDDSGDGVRYTALPEQTCVKINEEIISAGTDVVATRSFNIELTAFNRKFVFRLDVSKYGTPHRVNDRLALWRICLDDARRPYLTNRSARDDLELFDAMSRALENKAKMTFIHDSK